MTPDTVISIILVVVGLTTSVLGYLWKHIMNRIAVLEKEQTNRMTEQEVRNLLLDKIEPIKDTIKTVEKQLDIIIDKLLDK